MRDEGGFRIDIGDGLVIEGGWWWMMAVYL